MKLPHDSLQQKINETHEIMDVAKKQFAELDIPNYIQELQFSSIENRLQKLKKKEKEMKSVFDKESLVLSLYPPNLPSGQVSVRTLTTILGGLQNLSDSIANTLFNQPSEKGKIPQDILDQNELLIRETKAGSFKVMLDANHPEQVTLLDEPVQSTTISELFRLLESSNSSDVLAETISELGPRALRNYTEWTKSIKEQDTSIEIEWISSYHSSTQVQINTNKAKKIHAMLSEFSNTTESKEEVMGILTGANIRTKIFEIVTDEGDKITGKIKPNILGEIAKYGLNNKCIAEFLKVTVIDSANKEKTSWTLIDIKD